MNLWPGWLVVLAAACGAGSNAGSSITTATSGSSKTTGSTNASIVRVIDGDTVDVDFSGDRERVRLIGVDTPETKKPNTPIQCFGPEASAFTHEVLPDGTAVRVVRDAEARDDYGRLLAYVYRGSDGLFVNLELVVEGFARPLTIAPNDTFATQFVSAATAAEAADRGLWGACSG